MAHEGRERLRVHPRRLARPVCTERVPLCRRLLAVNQAPEPRLVGRSDATTRRRPEMRANTKKKHGMGKRFAVVIGVAAVGVMALGAQTVLAGGDRAPDLKLSGHSSQGGDPKGRGGPGPRAVAVSASCGEVSGPPVPWAPGLLKELRPPANLPDLGCHLSAEGKVMGDKLKPGRNAHVDLLGPRVQCEARPGVGRPHDLPLAVWFEGGDDAGAGRRHSSRSAARSTTATRSGRRSPSARSMRPARWRPRPARSG